MLIHIMAVVVNSWTCFIPLNDCLDFGQNVHQHENSLEVVEGKYTKKGTQHHYGKISWFIFNLLIEF